MEEKTWLVPSQLERLMHADKRIHETPELTEERCMQLLAAAGTPDSVQTHCVSVKEQALKICAALKAKGITLNEPLLMSAALLHDIARTEKDHAKVGGDWVTGLGYPQCGAMIARHHEVLSDMEGPEECVVLALADRSVRETEVVAIEERFAASRKKCKTEEALQRHEQRYADTIRLRNKINEICGREIIL